MGGDPIVALFGKQMFRGFFRFECKKERSEYRSFGKLWTVSRFIMISEWNESEALLC